jgi:hypothetical protein
MQGPRVYPKDGGDLAGAWTYPIATPISAFGPEALLHKLREAIDR